MEVFDHVACTVCGCVCDDLRIEVAVGAVRRCEGAYFLAEPWFFAQRQQGPPAAQIDGREAPLDDAIARAVELLHGAASPLLYGLSRSSTEGQRAAVALGERYRAA